MQNHDFREQKRYMNGKRNLRVIIFPSRRKKKPLGDRQSLEIARIKNSGKNHPSQRFPLEIHRCHDSDEEQTADHLQKARILENGEIDAIQKNHYEEAAYQFQQKTQDIFPLEAPKGKSQDGSKNKKHFADNPSGSLPLIQVKLSEIVEHAVS
jgi:hypothetical protein